MNVEKLRVAITIGDINGIGMEVIIKTFSDKRMLEFCTPVIYGSKGTAEFHLNKLGRSDFILNIINDSSAASAERLNLLQCWKEDVRIEIGKPSVAAGKYARLSLDSAIADLIKNKVDALVTAPINKYSMRMANFRYAGHTEYIAAKVNAKDALMLMTSDDLRVGLATGHIPLSEVAKTISAELIFSKICMMHKTLTGDFGISKPHIAVLGLNPHAGDEGVLGNEEIEIIKPAIKKANEKNIYAMGPFAADGMFGAGTYKRFDAILAMYHDQGLAPFKALSFGTGVNFTAGLPVVRTSPVHGTGYDIAGKNIASEESFRNAVLLACKIRRSRKGM